MPSQKSVYVSLIKRESGKLSTPILICRLQNKVYSSQVKTSSEGWKVYLLYINYTISLRILTTLSGVPFYLDYHYDVDKFTDLATGLNILRQFYIQYIN